MKFAMSKDEAALVLDALAQLPLARSYNLFQRLLGEVQAPDAALRPGPLQPAPEPEEPTT